MFDRYRCSQRVAAFRAEWQLWSGGQQLELIGIARLYRSTVCVSASIAPGCDSSSVQVRFSLQTFPNRIRGHVRQPRHVLPPPLCRGMSGPPRGSRRALKVSQETILLDLESNGADADSHG